MVIFDASGPIMKKLASIIAAATLIGTPALAADMAVKAPPPPPVPVYSWTGWYVGLNAGGGWQRGEIDNSLAPGSCPGFVPTFCPKLFPFFSPFPGEFDTDPSGFIGGGQIGYNYQTAGAVWGIEADFQGANITGSASAAVATPITFLGADVLTLTGTGSEKIDWFGTLRGRLGWTLTPSLLVYATGGLAYGNVKTSASFSGAILNDPAGTTAGSNSISQSDTRAGFTVGGGFEWMFAPQWSAKAEYLYYDLGTVTLNQTLTMVASFQPTATIGTNIQSVAHYNGSIARAGINYHF
jgi:outer membrane immunogenic protein